MTLDEQKDRLQRARKVSIYSFLSGIGIKPETETGSYYLYNSPLRSESKASFNVSKSKNSWRDYGNGQKGDLPDLVMQMYSKSLHGAIDIILGTPQKPEMEFKPIEKLKDAIEITHVGAIDNTISLYLIQYLYSRQIPLELAKIWLKHASIRFPYSIKNPTREYHCLAWINDSKGYELRNNFLKVSNSPKNITTILSGNDGAIHLYEGWPDFLSYLAFYNIDSPPHKTIVLNSISFLGAILPMLQNKVVVYWGQSDKAGEKAYRTLKNEGITVVDKRFIFKGYKDMNQFLIENSKKKLSKIIA
jgi:hypothetical protein